jgi:hypothetical protein
MNKRRLDLVAIGSNRSVKRSLDVGVGGNATLLATNHSVILVVADSHANLRRVDVAVTPDQEGTEARLSEEVEDAVEDSLRVGRDDVATLAKTPGDRVQDPEEGCQGAAVQEGLPDLGTVVGRVLTGLESEHVDDVEQRDAA